MVRIQPLNNGESIGIAGSTGAGKTTAVDLILGLLDPQGGRIEVDGVDIKTDLHAWLSQIGYIPQSIFMLDGNIRENVAFGVASKDISDREVWRALEEAALADFVKSLPDGLNTEIGNAESDCQEGKDSVSGLRGPFIQILLSLYLTKLPALLIMRLKRTEAIKAECEKCGIDFLCSAGACLL